MSKYAYTTVYEEFTGLKPPEPKTAKPRRRRGYGHPYRMRLNMQDETPQPTENYCESADTHQDSFETNERQPKSIFRANMRRQDAPYENTTHTHHTPKVTYKKRRHYTLSTISTDTID